MFGCGLDMYGPSFKLPGDYHISELLTEFGGNEFSSTTKLMHCKAINDVGP